MPQVWLKYKKRFQQALAKVFVLLCFGFWHCKGAVTRFKIMYINIGRCAQRFGQPELFLFSLAFLVFIFFSFLLFLFSFSLNNVATLQSTTRSILCPTTSTGLLSTPSATRRLLPTLVSINSGLKFHIHCIYTQSLFQTCSSTHYHSTRKT